MSSTLNRSQKLLLLATIIAAAAIPTTAIASSRHSSNTSSSAAPYIDHPPYDRNDTAQLPLPDAFERYAASHPYGKPASTPQRAPVPLYTPAMLAAHFNREDRLYQPRAASAPKQVSPPLYTPAMLAAHFNHEDLLYQPRPLPTNPSTIVSRGFDWTDWAIGLGSGIVLILALAGLLAFALQRRHRLQAA
jgi:hypothetical protein